MQASPQDGRGASAATAVEVRVKGAQLLEGSKAEALSLVGNVNLTQFPMYIDSNGVHRRQFDIPLSHSTWPDTSG